MSSNIASPRTDAAAAGQSRGRVSPGQISAPTTARPFLPRTALQQWLPPRAAAARRRLAAEVWTPVDAVVNIRLDPAKAEHRTAPTDADHLEKIEQWPRHEGGMFDQAWWHIELVGIEPDSDLWITFETEAQATLHHHGRPYGGFDPWHTHVAWPASTAAAWIESVNCWPGVDPQTCQSNAIHPQGPRYEGPKFWRRNELAWRASEDLSLLLELIAATLSATSSPDCGDYLGGQRYLPPLGNTSPAIRTLIDRVDRAVDAYEARGIDAIVTALDTVFDELPGDPTEIDAALTGHGHIDLVWRWPEHVGVFKAGHTFANVCRLMERYPELRFGYSQPASYEALRQRSPGLFKEVMGRVDEGAWEPTGAMLVESDCQLPCGEALARNFELGQKWFREHVGSESNVLWLPDVFGFSGCLPQIARLAGVTRFFTSKQNWSNINRFPFTSFRWQGHDGSELLAHAMPFWHYNGNASVEQIRMASAGHQQSHLHTESLVPTGLGDGGGGPTESACHRARRMADLHGLPRTRWSRIDAFYDRMEATRNELPIWSGEIYLEYHRGVYTTDHDLKSAYRSAERALQAADAIRVVTGGEPLNDQFWRRVCFAGFHDALPGTSIGEVGRAMTDELSAGAKDLQDTAANELAQRSPGSASSLFNPLGIDRCVLTTDRGETCSVRLPAWCGESIQSLPRVEETVHASATELKNDRVYVTFDDHGRVASMAVDGRRLRLCEPIGDLVALSDRPHYYEAWEIDRSSMNQGEYASPAVDIRVEESSSAVACVAFTRLIGTYSRIEIRYELRAGEGVLRVNYDVDWGRSDALLKAIFPTDYRGAHVRYGAPFGSTLRPQHPGRTETESRFECPGSRWAVVSDEAETDGLAVITESKYGFGAYEGLLHVSLLRSALVTDGVVNREMREAPGPERFDLGRRTVKLALGRSSITDCREDQPAMLAETLFSEPIAYVGSAVSSPLPHLEAGPTLIPSWIKPESDGGWTIRCHETRGQPGSVQLRGISTKAWKSIDLLGRELPRQPIDGILDFGPYQILSLRVYANSHVESGL